MHLFGYEGNKPQTSQKRLFWVSNPHTFIRDNNTSSFPILAPGVANSSPNVAFTQEWKCRDALTCLCTTPSSPKRNVLGY